MDKRLAHGRISVMASAKVAVEAVDPAPADPAPGPAPVPAAPVPAAPVPAAPVPAPAPPPTPAAAPRSPGEAQGPAPGPSRGRGRPRDLTRSAGPAGNLTASERSARHHQKKRGHMFYRCVTPTGRHNRCPAYPNPCLPMCLGYACGQGASTMGTARKHQQNQHGDKGDYENIVPYGKEFYPEIWELQEDGVTYKLKGGGKIGRIPDDPHKYDHGY